MEGLCCLIPFCCSLGSFLSLQHTLIFFKWKLFLYLSCRLPFSLNTHMSHPAQKSSKKNWVQTKFCSSTSSPDNPLILLLFTPLLKSPQGKTGSFGTLWPSSSFKHACIPGVKQQHTFTLCPILLKSVGECRLMARAKQTWRSGYDWG